MTIPHRGQTGSSTYLVTANTDQKKRLLQSERMAGLMIEVLYHYRRERKYLLHEFVVMPNHFHLLLTPMGITLERAVQFVKGGFSYRAGKELGVRTSIWQTSFHDRRVRDGQEYEGFRHYIHENPVEAGLAEAAGEYPYGSASGKFNLDEVPQRLKPSVK